MYNISEVEVKESNDYIQLMKKAGMDVDRAIEEIRKGLEGQWTEKNVETLKDFGILNGILAKQRIEENHFGEDGYKDEFLKNSDINTMHIIECNEYYLSLASNKEKIEELEIYINSAKGECPYYKLMLQKYRDEKRSTEKGGGNPRILDSVGRKKLTAQDFFSAGAVVSKQGGLAGVGKVFDGTSGREN